VFKVQPDPDAVAAALVREFTVKNVRSLGILAVQGPYGDAGVTALTGVAAQRNIRVVGTERFAETAREVDLQAERFVAVKPDAIIVWSPMPGAGTAARSLRDAAYLDRGGKAANCS
jgi:branched-chain amino acid transport system substrate-binding protein